MELQGQIIHIFDEKRISDKLTIREFVIKTPGEYPQQILVQTANAKTNLIIGKKVGDVVTAHINIRGRRAGVENKWFNSIECWKLEQE